MATHSSILAWRIPWTEESGGLQFIVLQRVGHNWSDSLHTQLSVELMPSPLWRSILKCHCLSDAFPCPLSKMTISHPHSVPFLCSTYPHIIYYIFYIINFIYFWFKYFIFLIKMFSIDFLKISVFPTRLWTPWRQRDLSVLFTAKSQNMLVYCRLSSICGRKREKGKGSEGREGEKGEKEGEGKDAKKEERNFTDK